MMRRLPRLRARLTRQVFAALLLPAIAWAQQSGLNEELRTAADKQSAAVAVGDAAQVKQTSQVLCAIGLRVLASAKLAEGAQKDAEELLKQSLALQDSAQAREELASAYLGAGDPSSSLLLTQQLLQQAPQDPQLWRLQGQAQMAAQDFAAAAASLSRAFELHRDSNTMFMLAVALLQAKEKPKVEDLFARAVQQAGESAALHVGFGIAYQESGYIADAIREFERALAVDAQTPNGHFLLGNAYLTKNAWSYNPDSEREFLAALQQSPDDYNSNLAMGLMMSEFGDYERGAKYLNAALAARPGAATPTLRLGFNAFEQGDHPSANKYLHAALEDGGSALDQTQRRRAYFILSKLAANQADASQALAFLKQAQQGSSNDRASAGSAAASAPNPATQTSMAKTALASPKQNTQFSPEQMQALREAEEQYRRLLGQAFNDWGTAEAQSGDFAAALARFHDAEHWEPNLEGLMKNLGLAAYKTADYKESARAFALARKEHDEPATKALLASSLALAGQYGEAATLFGELGEAVFSNAALTYQWALSLARTAQPQAAAKTLEHVDAQALSAPDAFAAGKLAAALGDRPRAVTFFEAAIAGFVRELEAHPESPEAAGIHERLAELYRLSGKPAEAAREQKLARPKR